MRRHPGYDGCGIDLLESDVTSVVQGVLDVPVVPDCGGGEARRYGGIGRVVSDLGGAAPQAGLGISMQDLAGDADDRFYLGESLTKRV